ncbi:hypothetical protein [Ottowia sp.]|uniref:hypothetical protein n=1 Tax=Ottowia sp. TaxID=1898956 RepID=UPI002BB5BF13|nr:hypothetical protein [Ottowia sp.]HOB66626.1 hypothetical protein [Ottowia sp.]HPZ56480.1 hypothetical protein [Ottowia sp.]HQD47622.1 hypothetical protein [Ottowia sp.]
MKVESVIVGSTPMFKLTRPDGQTRTGPALATLALLREALEAEQARHRQLQRELGDAEHAVRAAIGAGRNPTQARADVTRLQADMAGAGKRMSEIESLAADVREQAIEQIAAPIRQQFQAAVDAAAATFPATPQEHA